MIYYALLWFIMIIIIINAETLQAFVVCTIIIYSL
jgi:hypothetical protein